MGLFDFFKKRTANSGIVPIPDMISFGLEWREKFMEKCAIKNNSGVRAESLMFCCWYIWHHCMQKGRVSRDQSYAYDFFAHLMAYLQDDDTRFENLDFFMPLFQNRYSIFKTDLLGLVNSHYPQTKQYLPILTYKAFCLKPMQILNESESSLSSLTMAQDEEMTTFIGNLISFVNEMNKDLKERF